MGALYRETEPVNILLESQRARGPEESLDGERERRGGNSSWRISGGSGQGYREPVETLMEETQSQWELWVR